MAERYVVLIQLNGAGWRTTQPGIAEDHMRAELEANGGTLVAFARTLGPYDIVATIELDAARTPGFAQFLADEIGGEPLITRAYDTTEFHDAVEGWTMVTFKNPTPRQGP
ncbi:MAG: hypothetical protein ABSH51_23990 [Solirubrobacteraceae bacterium]|jgi:uncharacterized protein with GYD domain